MKKLNIQINNIEEDESYYYENVEDILHDIRRFIKIKSSDYYINIDLFIRELEKDEKVN